MGSSYRPRLPSLLHLRGTIISVFPLPAHCSTHCSIGRLEHPTLTHRTTCLCPSHKVLHICPCRSLKRRGLLVGPSRMPPSCSRCSVGTRDPCQEVVMLEKGETGLGHYLS